MPDSKAPDPKVKPNIHDAMRLMAIWTKPHSGALRGSDWTEITGTANVSSRVLWDYIRDALRDEGYTVEKADADPLDAMFKNCEANQAAYEEQQARVPRDRRNLYNARIIGAICNYVKPEIFRRICETAASAEVQP